MAASERESIGVPLTDWDTLARRLKDEDLLVPAARRRRGLYAGMRAAAALLLIGGGALMGRASTGATLIPGGLTGTAPAPIALNADSTPATFASVDEARRWQRVYATAYQRAVTYLAAYDTSASSSETPAVMRTRLSALDQVSRIAREALNDAPYDPVINDVYLNSFGQREATLRQLNAVLPQGVRLKSF
ncbi:MAG: hypothetical protein ACRDMZ_22190 [Solirubrobacteraceae bacterium]